METTIRGGYRVIGNNTSDGELSCWYFPELDVANKFAKQLAENTGGDVHVTKYLGTWKTVVPVEFVAAQDISQGDT